MKKKSRVIILILAVLIIFFIAANIIVGSIAPRIVERQIEENLKLKSSIGKISLSLPFIINIEKAEIGNLARIKKISFAPSLISLLFGKIVIHGLNIVEPVVNLEQSPDGKMNLPALEQKQKAPAIYLTSLRVVDGKIIFTDKKINPNGFQTVINRLNIKISKVVLPVTSLAADFNLTAQIADSKMSSLGDIAFYGKLDYLSGNMDAKLELKDLGLVNFSPYYGNFISNRKLASGSLNITSVFKSKNNDLKIMTVFNLIGLNYEKSLEEPQAEQGFEFGLTSDALDMFTDQQGNLRLEFEIDTKLNNPSLSPDKIKGIILKAAMKNLSGQSPEQIIDKVTSKIEKYKDIGKELKNIFKN
ncbi:MAG: DUF748 domain-containing protein [Candidatus Omnitrophica bacterium]|nr:DUF748 domain-containing protein [Candidatus Omnitrophota bacterium]